MKCVIFSGGSFAELPEEAVTQAFIIAADSGFDNAAKMGITPNLLVGDFDSITAKRFPTGIEIIKTPAEKDDTDTMLAARLAAERGFDEIHIACAFGGRLDHAVANLQVLAFLLSKGKKAAAYGENTAARIFDEGNFIIEKKSFDFMSVLAFSNSAVISISGVKYPLDKKLITTAFPLGTSNEILDKAAVLTVHEGKVLCIQAR